MMASCSDSDQTKLESSEIWTHILHEGGHASGTEYCSDLDDHELPCAAGQYDSQSVVASNHCPLFHNTESTVKTDDGDDDDTKNEHTFNWQEAGRALRTFLSETSETNLLFGNDDTLIINSDFACAQETVDRSVPAVYSYPQYSALSNTVSDWQSLPEKSYRYSSLPANDLLVLDDAPQMPFLSSFSQLRHKLRSCDRTSQDGLRPASWQRNDVLKDHMTPPWLGTWSELSSSDESDSRWCHREAYGNRRQCLHVRRTKPRWEDVLCSGSCSEEGECYNTDRLFPKHRSGVRKCRKRSTVEKKSALTADLQMPSLAGRSKQQAWCQDGASVTDCLADVESNATDSGSVGHVSDIDNDEDKDYDNGSMNAGISSSLVTPVACSFHCIPPDGVEKHASRCTSSSFYGSPVGSKDDHSLSSEGELSPGLSNIYAADFDSLKLPYSRGGRIA